MNNNELRETQQKTEDPSIAWVTRDLEDHESMVDNSEGWSLTVLTFTEETLKYLDVDGRRVTELKF